LQSFTTETLGVDSHQQEASVYVATTAMELRYTNNFLRPVNP